MKHRLRVSKGNVKLGLIPSVSLPAVETCPRSAPCALSGGVDCYVKGMYRRRPNILVSHEANLALLNHSRDSFFTQVESYLVKHKPDMFRIHVSGDYIDCDYLGRWMNTGAGFPKIKFLSFTKAYHVLPEMVGIIPPNFTIIASAWPGYQNPPLGYRVAWMDDGREDRIPSDAIACPGLCESCGLCWNLPSIGRDVVFRAH